MIPSPAPPPSPPPLSLPASPAARVLALLVLLLPVAVMPSAAARADGPRWQWPVPPPHEVIAPFDAPATPYGPGHRGIDIAVPGGAEVRAVEGGTVRFSGSVAGRGVVSVVHPDGLISTYEPVRGAVSAGDPVGAGQVLGTLEDDSPASHCDGRDCLHLGARRGELYVDPLLLLGGRGPSVLLPWSGGASGGGAGAAGPGDSPGAGPAGAAAGSGSGAGAEAGPAAGTSISPRVMAPVGAQVARNGARAVTLA
ncbi:murein hydrolase activator EnvC family protein [Brachybacterium paraconglomeratum]|uniref:murein hydrolase activator EnvC family protein n=1 Tax=Brachybacterium paraconglomeratum TaxID=173362 RepID=UPI003FCF4E63